jgi:ABC-type branched-subunit amino acid transport system ATPase component
VQRAYEVLSYFNLESIAQNWGSDLSGGQERLVELARILMLEPQVILLDEPFAGVSPRNRKLLARQLRALCDDKHITIVMVEHRLQLVEELCDSIVFMADGRPIAEGSLSDLRQIRSVVDSYLGEGHGSQL